MKASVLTHIIAQVFELLNELLLLETGHPSKNHPLSYYFRDYSWEVVHQVAPRVAGNGKAVMPVLILLYISATAVAIGIIDLKTKKMLTTTLQLSLLSH